MRPNSLAQAVSRYMGHPAPLYHHVNEFLDEFYENPDQREAMIEDAPIFLDDQRQNAWIGGVGEHLARRWGLEIPAWTEDRRRFLDMPYFVGSQSGVKMKKILLMESPISFRRRNVFTEAEPLRRARMPR